MIQLVEAQCLSETEKRMKMHFSCIILLFRAAFSGKTLFLELSLFGTLCKYRSVIEEIIGKKQANLQSQLVMYNNQSAVKSTKSPSQA